LKCRDISSKISNLFSFTEGKKAEKEKWKKVEENESGKRWIRERRRK
jgi:hypothetical protein